MRLHHLPLLAVTATTATMLAACSTRVEPLEEKTPDLAPFVDNQDLEGLTVVEAEPSFVITLEGGEQLKFFADEDGSVGVLGDTPLGSRLGSALDHADLTDASPAMIYFAVTQSGDIPEALLEHHEALVEDGEIIPFPEAVASWDRGWFLSLAGKNNWSSPCANATFNTNHCANPQYADELCYFNTSSNLTWNVPSTSRYKAGYCLQQGSNRSWLYYLEGAGDCLYNQSANFVWGFDSALFGDKYTAETYRTWTWWRPSGSPVRSWHHFGGDGSGDVFDWGQRWTQASCQ
ncbi:MAG: hypothetical protein KC731_10600 [Myxococcales bacterium]|nr:hypothetical protein [Myxococcales bacterium]